MSNPVALWLQAKLGTRYPVVLRGVDGAVTTFLTVFSGSLLAADVFNLHKILLIDIWQKAALAGAAAALSVIKSTVMTLITGQSALLGLFSRQLRADRERPVAKHPVSVRPASKTRTRRPAKKTAAHPAKKAAPPAAYHGEHEAKEPGQ